MPSLYTCTCSLTISAVSFGGGMDAAVPGDAVDTGRCGNLGDRKKKSLWITLRMYEYIFLIKNTVHFYIFYSFFLHHPTFVKLLMNGMYSLTLCANYFSLIQS